eukprot:scaffold837_cov416-Prasinococcus_capsulatus_cf.AAC.12
MMMYDRAQSSATYMIIMISQVDLVGFQPLPQQARESSAHHQADEFGEPPRAGQGKAGLAHAPCLSQDEAAARSAQRRPLEDRRANGRARAGWPR